MIPSIRQTPLRVLFLAVLVAVVGLMTVADLPSACPVHAQEQQVTATRYAPVGSPNGAVPEPAWSRGYGGEIGENTISTSITLRFVLDL